MSKEENPVSEVSVDQIASAFLRQYYQRLSTGPADLYHFYSNDSSYTHGETSAPLNPVIGKQEIQEHISQHIDFLEGARIDFTEGTLDAQKSEGGSILGVVTGLFTPRQTEIPHHFVHTFLLALSDKSNSTSFYVRNSVFRLLHAAVPVVVDVAPTPTPLPVPEPTPVVEEPVPAPITPPALPTPVPVPEVESIETPVPQPVVAPAPTLDIPEEPVPESVSAPAPVPTPVPEPVLPQAPVPVLAPPPSAPVSEPVVKAPRSFAEALKLKKETPSLSFTPSPPSPLPNPPSPTPSVSSPTPAPSTSSPSTPTTPSTPQPVLPSLYVRNLPDRVTKSEVDSYFSQFGRVIKIEPVTLKQFAFVYFETSDVLRDVLDRQRSSPLMLPTASSGLVEVKVEERNAKTGTTGTGGGGGGGSFNRRTSTGGHYEKGQRRTGGGTGGGVQKEKEGGNVSTGGPQGTGGVEEFKEVIGSGEKREQRRKNNTGPSKSASSSSSSPTQTNRNKPPSNTNNTQKTN